MSLLKSYRIVVLGDREFCSVTLANWLRQEGVCFCLRLKKNEYVEREQGIFLELKALGLAPGNSLYLAGIKVTKQKGCNAFNLAAKWKGKYRKQAPTEGWFILTNLGDLESAIDSYRKRFDIEEMFRDWKSGGYNLEDTNVSQKRFMSLLVLVTIAYFCSTIYGKTIKRMGLQKYVGRVQEAGRQERRHSNFYIGLYGQTWVSYPEECIPMVLELLRLNPNKLRYYQKGLRAMKLIRSGF